MIKKLPALILFSFMLSFAASAQSTGNGYTTAVGVKFYPGAISVKHFVGNNNAIEGLGYFYNRGARFTGLFEIHSDINGAPGLKWYAGPGAHVGSYNNKYGGGFSAGIDGVLGLDFKVNGAPLNLSIDWQPSYEFGSKNQRGFVGNWGRPGYTICFLSSPLTKTIF